MIEVETIKAVQLDGLVALKIVQHCREFLPSLVTGQLLGLGRENTLEITHSFPFPNKLEGEAENEEKYQLEMMHCLRDVNVDHNTVGWYQSCYMGSFITHSLIETQFNYQQTIPESVVLVFDPERSVYGNLCIRAFQLTDVFMAAYKEKKFKLDKLTHCNVLQELPVTIKNCSLINHFLSTLPELKSQNFDFLNIPAASYLEKSMEVLMEYLEEKQVEDSKMENYVNYIKMSKKKEDDSLVAKPVVIMEPSRLDSLLINAQILDCCNNIESFIEVSQLKLKLDQIL